MMMKIGIPLTLTLSVRRSEEKKKNKIRGSFSLDGRR
jgi:hypothetical protein